MTCCIYWIGKKYSELISSYCYMYKTKWTTGNGLWKNVSYDRNLAKTVWWSFCRVYWSLAKPVWQNLLLSFQCSSLLYTNMSSINGWNSRHLFMQTFTAIFTMPTTILPVSYWIKNAKIRLINNLRATLCLQ